MFYASFPAGLIARYRRSKKGDHYWFSIKLSSVITNTDSLLSNDKYS